MLGPAAALIAVAVLAGCGGGYSSGGASTTGGTAAAGAGSSAGSSSGGGSGGYGSGGGSGRYGSGGGSGRYGSGGASGGSAPSGAAVVAARSGPLGTHLTDGSGRTLYLFMADTGSTSTCTGGCVQYWPPLLTKGAPKASGQARASLLGTSARSDGGTQVTYHGHPLYYFAQDTSPGQELGQGSTGSGARWWVVSPSGTAITGMAAGKPSSSSGGYGG